MNQLKPYNIAYFSSIDFVVPYNVKELLQIAQSQRNVFHA